MTITTFIPGPRVPDSLEREIWAYDSNLAPAYIPKPLREESSSVDSVDAQKLNLPVTASLLKSLGEDFSNHMEYRMQVFLTMLVLVHKTGYVFENYFSADFQIGSASLGKKGEKSRYAAAHSSTFSALRVRAGAHSIAVWHHTHFHMVFNATIYLPKKANQVDSLIDSSKKDGVSFRERAILILNEVSKGSQDPAEGFKSFLKHLLSQISYLKKADQKELRSLIYGPYLETARNYWSRLEKGHLLHQLLFQPDGRKLEDVFTSVHANMHGSVEGFTKRYQVVRLPLVSFDWKALHAELKEYEPLKGRSEEYVQIALLSTKVQKKAFEALGKGVKNALIDRTLREEVLNAIYCVKLRRVKLRGIEKIVEHILMHIICSRMPNLPTKVKGEKKRTAADLVKLVVEEGSTLRLKPTAERYLSSCQGSKKVVEAAKKTLGDLQTMSEKEVRRFYDHVSKNKIPKVFSSLRDVVKKLILDKENIARPHHMFSILIRLLSNAGKESVSKINSAMLAAST